MAKPLPLRKLRAEMALKELTLRQIALSVGIPYSTASEILSGARVDSERLIKLTNAIHAAPNPSEVAQ